MVKWQKYRFNRDHYITVRLSVTDHQRQALVEQAIASGYGNIDGSYTDDQLQFYVGDVLEFELKERFPEMSARFAAYRASIMSEMAERQSKKQT